MNPIEVQALASALVTGIVEGLKWLWRKFVAKDLSYDFPVAFYAISLPVLNALTPFVLVYGLGIQMTDPILALSWLGVVRYVLIVALGAVGSLMVHSQAVKPMKNYARQIQGTKDLNARLEMISQYRKIGAEKQ